MIRWQSSLIAIFLVLGTAAVATAEFPFAVLLDGHRVSLEEYALYASPGDAVALQLDGQTEWFSIDYDGESVKSPDGTVLFTAPSRGGVAHANITQRRTGRKMKVNIFATLPSTEIKNGRLGDYRIGEYPSVPLRGDTVYLPPRGFVEITEASADTRISPNFTVGHFACKQSDSFPKYSVMRPNLAWKLERILDELNAAHVEVETFVIMSGYRTPYYNEAIGNVAYSRHVYGDAADIYIDDNPRDGVMDDLNQDGRVSKADAEWLAAFIDNLERSGKLDGLIGGLSAYGATSAHGPFVHVDTRGRLVRW